MPQSASTTGHQGEGRRQPHAALRPSCSTLSPRRRPRSRSAPCGPLLRSVSSLRRRCPCSSRTRSFGHGALLDHRLLLMEHDLMLLLGDLGAGGRLADVLVGDRLALERTSSRCTGTVFWTSSVTTYLRSRTRPRLALAVPTRSSSSERVIASSVVGPLVSRPRSPRCFRRRSEPCSRARSARRAPAPPPSPARRQPRFPEHLDLLLAELELDLCPIGAAPAIGTKSPSAEQAGVDQRPLGLADLGV